MNAAAITNLVPASDAARVRAWLRVYLAEHLAWWTDAYGLGWDEARVEAHLDAEPLIEREWRQLSAAAESELDFVGVARDDDGAPAGIVHASEQVEHFLQIGFGALQWIYVAPEARGRGVGAALMDAATSWMRRRELPGAYVFVTKPNELAVKLYQSRGFSVVDHRMLLALPP